MKVFRLLLYLRSIGRRLAQTQCNWVVLLVQLLAAASSVFGNGILPFGIIISFNKLQALQRNGRATQSDYLRPGNGMEQTAHRVVNPSFYTSTAPPILRCAVGFIPSA